MFSVKYKIMQSRGIKLLACTAGLLLIGVASAAAQTLPELPKLDVAAPKSEKVDPFAVPDGTPAELYAYIQGLQNARPERQDRESIINFMKKMGWARIEACEKILASDAQINEKQPAAAMLLTTSAQMAMRLGDPQAAKTLAELPSRFEKMNLPQFAKAAKATIIQIDMMMAIQGIPGAPPLEKAIEAFKKFVEQSPDMESLQLMMLTIQGLSKAGKTAPTIDLCHWAKKVFGKIKDQKAIEILKIIAGTARRLELPGSTMIVKGPLMDGKPYDLANEKGKVVLVQYWATWCEPCLLEIANVKKYYPLYHKRGFDVIGISIDDDKSQLEAYLKDNKLPWPVMLDSQAKESNAARYGVMGIPQLILVDREGKVVTLDARGSTLGRELEKLLGPPEEPGSKAADGK